jgi:hypothetical protein
VAAAEIALRLSFGRSLPDSCADYSGPADCLDSSWNTADFDQGRRGESSAVAAPNQSAFPVMQRFWLGIWVSAWVAVALGCRTAPGVRDPEADAVCRQAAQSCQFPDPAATIAPVFPDLDGPHPVEHYIAFALAQNPEIQAARREVEARANRVPQEASLADPTIDAMTWPFYPNVPQTASGRMRWDLRVGQELPWPGKLERRAEAAEAEVQQSQAELAAAELAVIEQVKRAYYELYYVEQATHVTATEQRLLAPTWCKLPRRCTPPAAPASKMCCGPKSKSLSSRLT